MRKGVLLCFVVLVAAFEGFGGPVAEEWLSVAVNGGLTSISKIQRANVKKQQRHCQRLKNYEGERAPEFRNEAVLVSWGGGRRRGEDDVHFTLHIKRSDGEHLRLG